MSKGQWEGKGLFLWAPTQTYISYNHTFGVNRVTLLIFLERALSHPSIHPLKAIATLTSSPLNYSNSPLPFPFWAPRIFNWLHHTPSPGIRQLPACLSSSDPANTFQILFLFQKPEITMLAILAPGVLDDFPDERSDSHLRSWGGGRK